jgi:pimeloyl-ACP methyl ester carboxylesterase
VARAKPGRVSKAALVSAVPPVMIKSDKNPGGLPIEVFDGLRTALAANRAQFYIDIPTGPFYGFNRPGAQISQALIDNWWRQGMMGGAKWQTKNANWRDRNRTRPRKFGSCRSGGHKRMTAIAPDVSGHTYDP